MDFLSQLDTQLFLLLNGLHADWLDVPMIAITKMWIWLPIYCFLIRETISQYGKQWWWVALAIGIVVLCSDQISAHVCKPLFHRLRPCYNTDIQDLVHLPKGLAGGRFGFVSSHAANTFAIATFLNSILRKGHKWIGYTVFCWAGLSSYSRIYIGYHYPGDIICGAVLGILIGSMIAKIFNRLSSKKLIA